MLDSNVSKSLGRMLKMFVLAPKLSQSMIGIILGSGTGVLLRYFPNALSNICFKSNGGVVCNKLGKCKEVCITDANQLIKIIDDFLEPKRLIPLLTTILTIPAIFMVIKRIAYIRQKKNNMNDVEIIDDSTTDETIQTKYLLFKVITTLCIFLISFISGITIAPNLNTESNMEGFVESVKNIDLKNVAKNSLKKATDVIRRYK